MSILLLLMTLYLGERVKDYEDYLSSYVLAIIFFSFIVFLKNMTKKDNNDLGGGLSINNLFMYALIVLNGINFVKYGIDITLAWLYSYCSIYISYDINKAKYHDIKLRNKLKDTLKDNKE